MAILREIKFWQSGGLNNDDAVEYVPKNDYLFAQNVRMTGTGSQEAGAVTNIESNTLLTGSLPSGINDVIGGNKFDNTGQIVAFRYNSAGYNQILLYSADTASYEVIFTDDPENPILPLNPQKIVKCVLINQTYLIWWAEDLEVGYTNLTTLASGGYGSTPSWEDISLLKPQCMPPPTGEYGSDAGQPANYLFGLLPQFAVQYVNADYNYSAWSTRSKRIVPYQQNTPVLGSDVTQSNYIIVSADIGSSSTRTINIACRFGEDIFNIVKSVDRTYVLALPNTAVDVSSLVYEAYNPTTNIYQFVFYNNEVGVPISPIETDLFYDYIWPANAGEVINGNIMGLGDWKLLYDRPSIDVNIGAVGYDANIDIPVETYPNKFSPNGSESYPDSNFISNNKFRIVMNFIGYPREGDQIIVTTVDLRDASQTFAYPVYTVPSSQEGDLAAVVASFAATLPDSTWYLNEVTTAGQYTIRFIPYSAWHKLQIFSIQLDFGGSTVSNSIPAVLDNAAYQLALSFRDYKSRPFPLTTGNNYKVTTPSYAQVNGGAVQINWQINSAPPEGAVDAQWLITKPQITAMLDVLGTTLTYQGAWDAYANTPSLSVNTGTVGDTYQITTPSSPSNPDHYTNLGNGLSYNTGDYVTYNGQSWDVIPKEFGDLTDNGNILAINLNPLRLFNDEFADRGVDTILSYNYSVGDRCTFHYYIDGSGNDVYINNPCVNLSVFGYDEGSYLVKVEKPANFDTSDLEGKNLFLRLYSPALTTTAQNQTVWYEIGERITITNGAFDATSGTITDGGVYYKTRQYADAVEPYTQPPVQTLSTDLNYSDFYPSAFSSFGRPRTYYDVLEPTEQRASIIISQSYVLGSRNNGLNRFYPETIYGEGDGQTSSSQGAIQIMWQRGNTLVVIQELGTFYIPVNEAYTQVNAALTGTSLSEKLLNNGRYDTHGIGIGRAKESFCTRYGVGYFIDPNKSIPMRIDVNGIVQIDGKMSQYMKNTLQAAYALGKKLQMFYNDYYEEVLLCIQAASGILVFYPFSNVNWRVGSGYTITPSDVTATPDGSHCSASYNPTSGVVVYTPSPSTYVGTDVATFTFNVAGVGLVTVNNCLEWTAGSESVDSFSFVPLFTQPLSSLVYSNTILVNGNTIPAPISISSGGEYNSGSGWVSTAGTVNDGDTVQVRQTTSGSFSTETIVTLTIDGQSAGFSATTLGAPPSDEVPLFPTVLSVNYSLSFITFNWAILEEVADNLDVAYTVSILQGGITYNYPTPPAATILTGNTATLTLEIPFTPSNGTVTSVTFAPTAVDPPTSGGKTITYDASTTIVV